MFTLSTNGIMAKFAQLFTETLLYVTQTLLHNGPVLMIGITVAAAIAVYVDPEKMRQLLMKRKGVSLGASVALGTFTPFCACGTMAVIVSMMTTALPWGPIMAFLTSSPLMSPDEFILYSGIIGVNFAVALTLASIIIGLSAGLLTHWIEKNTTFLNGQGRISDNREPRSKHAAATCCNSATLQSLRATSCSCSNTPEAEAVYEVPRIKSFDEITETLKLKAFAHVFYTIGIKQVLVYFTVFAAIGYLINRFVPAELIMTHLGSGNPMAVPLLSLIGLPLYVNGASAIPIIQTLLAGGASPGALLAFMITGPGTSAGVIAGLMTIMKKRAIALYVFYLLTFAILLGYAYDAVLMWMPS